jgi:outer membrane assembly lipoprotein YfiO
LSQTDEAIDMPYRIQEKSPGSALAERAMLRTADYYYNTGQFDLSADVYSAFLRSYPRSPDVPRVRLRRAFSSYAQFRGTRFDATPLIEARAQMEDLKVKYPEMAQEVNVQKFIDDINTTLAQKLMVTAEFYLRTGHPQAAAVTYREVMATYTDAKEAQQAEAALKSLPASAQAAAELPPGKAPFEATTRPVFGPIGSSTRPSGLPLGPLPGGSGVGPVDRGGPITPPERLPGDERVVP